LLEQTIKILFFFNKEEIMITVDLNRRKTLEWDISSEDEKNIESVHFIILLPQRMGYQFKAFIKEGIITAHLPPLKNRVEKGTKGICYLEVCDTNSVYRKICNDRISFEEDIAVKLRVGFPSQKKDPHVTLKNKGKKEAVIDSPFIELRSAKATGLKTS